MNKKNVIYIVNPKIVIRREGREAILYDTENGGMDIINETGVFIVKLCNGKNTQDAVISKVLKKYSGNNKKITLDTIEFLNRLKKNKVIEAKK